MPTVAPRSRLGGLRRLLTPGLAWLVVGLGALLGAIVTLGVQDPAPPSLDMGALDLLSSLGLWGGLLLVSAAGLGAAGNGLLLLARYDREESLSVDEVAQPAPTVVSRVLVRGGVGALALGVATAMAVGLLVEPGRETPLVLWGLAGVLGLVGFAGVGLAYLGLGSAPPSDQQVRRFAQTRQAGLQRPLRHLHLGLLILLTLTAVGLQLTLVRWVVEDAAISFAYARHLAQGEGLVTYPGGERVEGYSNPLWTFLLAAWYLVGVDGFTSNKIMAAVFAAVTVPLTFGIAREARPHRSDLTPVVAAALLTFSAQFTIWGAGGLENSLLNVLLAAALWRALVESRTGSLPFSAVLWLGVALTRPDGLMYAAIGGFWSMIFRISAVRQALLDGLSDPSRLPSALWKAAWPTLAWLAFFFVPFGLYQTWRYDYFAWELPNTYYAKKGNPTKAFEPYSWSRKGWKYLRGWSHHLAHGYLLPVYALGLLGRRGVRGGVALLCMILCAGVLFVPGPDWFSELLGWDPALPEWWIPARVWTLFLVAVLAPFAAIGRPGWRALVLVQGVGTAALFFAIYAGGDWMNGYRWMATFAVPGAVLLAVGLAEVGDALRGIDRRTVVAGVAVGAVLGVVGIVGAIRLWVPPSSDTVLLGDVGARGATPGTLLGVVGLLIIAMVGGILGQRRRASGVRWGPLAWVAVVALFGASVVPSVTRLDRFLDRPTTSPWSVRRRVNYMNWVQARLHIDEQPVNLDVDMGANMYWSNDRIVDLAGLVDVSMGHHWFDRPFIHEYIFEDRRPHFAHVHGGWASTSRLKTYDAWKQGYIEITPYPTGRTSQHPGNHVRKDLIVPPTWDGPPGRSTVFERGLVLQGWQAPAGLTAPGRHLYVELGWTLERPMSRGEGFRAIVFLSGPQGVVHSWDAPPGYDWYLPQDWEVGEVVVSKLSLELPDDLPAGTYDLGVWVHDLPRARVLRALGAADAPLDDSVVPDGAVLDPEQAQMARGEIRWTDAIEVTSAQAVDARAAELRDQALQQAQQGACDAAEQSWLLARRTTTRTLFDERNKPRVAHALAGCWARHADSQTARNERVAAFEASRLWEHHHPELHQLRRPDVDALFEQGLQAREAQDWAGAHAAFQDVLRMDPSRSWARRHAIEAQDCKLRIRLDEHDCGVLPPDEPRTSPTPRRITPRQTPAQRALPQPRRFPRNTPPARIPSRDGSPDPAPQPDAADPGEDRP